MSVISLDDVAGELMLSTVLGSQLQYTGKSSDAFERRTTPLHFYISLIKVIEFETRGEVLRFG